MCYYAAQVNSSCRISINWGTCHFGVTVCCSCTYLTGVVIVMTTELTHNLHCCILLGPAHQIFVTSSKACFCHPAGIDVLVINAGKNELAFVCDKGNSCIRVIKGVHSFLGEKFISTLKIQNVPWNWKPKGLAVISKDTLVVSEGKMIYLVSMDGTLSDDQLYWIT